MPATWSDWWGEVTAGIDAGAAPGAGVWIQHRGRVVLDAVHGLAATDPSPEPLRPGMLYDLASITKAVATTSCLAALVLDGALDLDAPVAVHLPEAVPSVGALTCRQLVTHTAGLPAHRRFHEACHTRDEVRAAVLATEPETPPGSACEYSDLGFLLLGFLIEQVTSASLAEYFRARVAGPLDLADDLLYRPLDPLRCVPTERCPIRGEVVRGLVHDENAWRCDGIAGHAGLFGTAQAVGRFAAALLHDELLPGARQFLFAPRTDPARDRFWLGWKRLDYGSGDESAFGHDGFTGTLVWVCPGLDLVIALLTNRVHPTRANRRIYELRPTWLHRAAAL